MIRTLNKIISETDSQIKELELEQSNVLIKSELAIALLRFNLDEIKKEINSSKFKTITDEIHFFKSLKPSIFSRLIYYTKIFNIETKRPIGSDKIQRKYLENELDKLKRFFDNNLEFYQYYRANYSHLDDKYFVRGKQDIRLHLDSFIFNSDPTFSTSHDYRVSKILANDLLEIYLKGAIESLERKDGAGKTLSVLKDRMQWNDSKVGLTELVYALHASGCFNKGNAELKDIAVFFQIAFNVDLGDIYRTWAEIRTRKTGKTKFLDMLKENLTRKIDKIDSK